MNPDPAIFVIDITNIKKFSLLLFEGAFTLFFNDKKARRSHKALGITVFRTIFAW
jgi:hypothetical protein